MSHLERRMGLNDTFPMTKPKEEEVEVELPSTLARRGHIIELSSSCSPPTPDGDFGIGFEQLASMTRDRNSSALEQYGGVKGIAALVQTNLETGISGDDVDISKRRNALGSNTYLQKKGKSLLAFLWDACQDTTLIILTIAAVVSLASGIKTEDIKEGWCNGGSIVIAVVLIIVVKAVSGYWQSLQFQNLKEETWNIQLEVIRGERRERISINDIVVEDVVPLQIGDQVPADGIFITGHSLAIDESSITRHSEIIHKDQNAPFLLAGCRVSDGFGDMLVTGVGINTKWGILMACTSEDIDGEIPLQVRSNGVATSMGMVGLSVGAAVLAILFVQFFTGTTKNGDGRVQFIRGQMGVSKALHRVIEIITIVVTIVVVAVPKGLPLAVTLRLAYLMLQMMADKALVMPWGRSVYAKVQKFIQFQLTVNVAALIINFMSAIAGRTIPLNAVQLLWVNLIMGTLGALTLATKPPINEVMRRALQLIVSN